MTAHADFQLAVAQLLEVDADQLALDTPFERFETWDSFAMISIVALVTEHFGVKISGEVVRKSRSLSDVIDRVTQLSAAAA